MALTMLFSCSLFLLFFSYGRPETLQKPSGFQHTCHQIAAAISGASQVFFPPSPEYTSDIFHPSSSSSEVSACSVEPGSAEDVSKILRILGPSRTPFAVKGGAHINNPGFSSTKGVQISMSRFNDTKVNYKSGTVEIGAGLKWGQVYAALEPTRVSVVGARFHDVGVAGSTLGGGYSFKSSQYGLIVDNVAGYELVLPNGTITNVTSKNDDLRFGLRGGLNNFGIVTKFILNSHPQGDVWGGIRVYSESHLDAVKETLVKIQQKHDTKAALQISLTYVSGKISVAMAYFYDAASPSKVFDDFLAIPAISTTTSTRSYSDLVQSLGFQTQGDLRAFLDDAPVTHYSPAVFDAFVNQTRFWGKRLGDQYQNVSVDVTLEPFDKGVFSHGSGSAYPPDRSHAVFPSVITIDWFNSSIDETIASALRQFSGSMRAAALADGQNVSHAAKYVNYALFGTPLKDIYGGNVERLRKIRAAIDPEDVMGLAGGWKF